MEAPYLLVTTNDYRTPRQGNMQFTARELAKRGKTRFFSIGFSLLSRINGDPRSGLWSRSNVVETVDQIDCYLWRTPFHPGNLHAPWLERLSHAMFRLYVRIIPDVLIDWVRNSRTIYLESGLPVAFFETVRRLNPTAQIAYIASDDLKTINCANYLLEEFSRTGPQYDAVFAISPQLCKNFPAGTRSWYVPHGLDTTELRKPTRSPFGGGKHAVSVGNMLFDPSVIQIAALAFPDVTFHVIGAGPNAKALSALNIKLYGEMPWRDIVPYLQHANVGIAPYNGMATPYLADTSMKLKQYGFVGLPAICPDIVAGSSPGRFGYQFGKPETIIEAMRKALASRRLAPQPTLTWSEHAERLVSPAAFEDCMIGANAH
jgi:2-beta-glucuronyltransferase